MSSPFPCMTQTIDYANLRNHRPDAKTLIAELLRLEKTAKQEKRIYPFSQLLGRWQLTFITGTRKAQKQAGVVLSQGRYLPRWITVAIAYSAAPDNDPNATWQKGTVLNSVQFGLLNLAVSGCIKYQAPKRLLAFDFTQINVKLAGLQLYDGALRGGSEAAAKFHETPISQQAFFSYFYVSEQAIAARGKGGGIALWTKIN